LKEKAFIATFKALKNKGICVLCKGVFGYCLRVKKQTIKYFSVNNFNSANTDVPLEAETFAKNFIMRVVHEKEV